MFGPALTTRLAQWRRVRRSIRPALAVLSAWLLVVGAPGGVLSRGALAEYEVKGQCSSFEELASHSAPRIHERVVRRRAHHAAPAGCFAPLTCSNLRSATHGQTQPLRDALRDHNGFGGPLLI